MFLYSIIHNHSIILYIVVYVLYIIWSEIKMNKRELKYRGISTTESTSNTSQSDSIMITLHYMSFS